MTDSFGPPPRLSSNRRTSDFLWAVAGLLLFVSRFGYVYGTGDQDELLPFLLRLLDDGLFARDWFVQSQTEAFSVRTYFVWALLPPSWLLRPEWVFWGVYGALGTWIGACWIRLSRRLGLSESAAVLGMLIGLVVTHKWTLGGNDLVYGMLVPEMAAWALALPALASAIDGRHRRAAILFGAASWFQLLAGLLPAVVTGCTLLFRSVDQPRSAGIRQAGVFGLLFLAAAAPAIVPLVLQQVEPVTNGDAPSIFYILSAFRNPFHHLPLSFSVGSWVKFGGLLLLGAVGFAGHPARASASGRFIVRFAGVTLALCALATVFTEAYPLLIVAKLQVFKLTVLLKLLAVIFLAAGLLRLAPARWRAAFDDHPTRSPAVALTLLAAGLGSVWLHADRIQPPWQTEPNEPERQVETWARAATAVDALFAVPPSDGSFRSNAQRAIVINYGAFPFRDADMVTWYARLLDVAPIQPPRRGLGVKTALDSAFYAHSSDAWLRLRSRYGIDYVAGDARRFRPDLPFEVAFRADSWVVLRLDGGLQ